MIHFGGYPKGGLAFTGDGVHVVSPVPQESAGVKARDRELFISNFRLLWENRARIFADPELYDAPLSFSALSCAFLGGGPVSLGILLELWEDGRWIEPCPNCGGECRVFYRCGSILSGANKWWGFCMGCGEDWINGSRPAESGFSREVHAALKLIHKHARPIVVKNPPFPSDFATWAARCRERYESGAVVRDDEREKEIIPVDDTRSLREVVELLSRDPSEGGE